MVSRSKALSRTQAEEKAIHDFDQIGRMGGSHPGDTLSPIATGAFNQLAANQDYKTPLFGFNVIMYLVAPYFCTPTTWILALATRLILSSPLAATNPAYITTLHAAMCSDTHPTFRDDTRSWPSACIW